MRKRPSFCFSLPLFTAWGVAVQFGDFDGNPKRERGLDKPRLPPLEIKPLEAGSPVGKYYLPPRLGIAHLLAWTAITALLFR